MLNSIIRLSVISVVISLVFGQLDNIDPTHIIKFKTSVTRNAGIQKEKKRKKKIYTNQLIFYKNNNSKQYSLISSP